MNASLVNFLHVAFSWAAVGGAVLALLGTAGTFFTSIKRDEIATTEAAALQARMELAEKDGAEREQAAAAETAKLRDQLQKAEEERLELERLTVPRRITPTIAGQIESALRPFAGQPYRLSYEMMDAQAQLYARQFQDVLDKAGWQLVGDVAQIGWGEPRPGLRVECALSTNETSLLPATKALAQALTAAKLIDSLTIDQSHGVEPDQVGIWVGRA